jgi:hypothetical protein
MTNIGRAIDYGIASDLGGATNGNFNITSTIVGHNT